MPNQSDTTSTTTAAAPAELTQQQFAELVRGSRFGREYWSGLSLKGAARFAACEWLARFGEHVRDVRRDLILAELRRLGVVLPATLAESAS